MCCSVDLVGLRRAIVTGRKVRFWSVITDIGKKFLCFTSNDLHVVHSSWQFSQSLKSRQIKTAEHVLWETLLRPRFCLLEKILGVSLQLSEKVLLTVPISEEKFRKLKCHIPKLNLLRSVFDLNS